MSDYGGLGFDFEFKLNIMIIRTKLEVKLLHAVWLVKKLNGRDKTIVLGLALGVRIRLGLRLVIFALKFWSLLRLSGSGTFVKVRLL